MINQVTILSKTHVITRITKSIYRSNKITPQLTLAISAIGNYLQIGLYGVSITQCSRTNYFHSQLPALPLRIETTVHYSNENNFASLKLHKTEISRHCNFAKID